MCSRHVRAVSSRSAPLSPRVPGPHRHRRTRSTTAGQSFVEFALVLPFLALVLLLVADFGRVYMGWVQLNNAARVAANYAGQYPTASFGPGSTYATLTTNDAAGSDCPLPTTPPAPTFPNGTDLGDQAQVNLTCNFNLIVSAFPGFGQLLPNPVTLSATAYFPVRTGTAAVAPANCTSGTAPSASYTANPTSGGAPLTVQFTDTSTGSPTGWSWDFGDGQTSTTQSPTHTFASAGTYLVAMTATNVCGESVATPVTVTVTGLIAAFTGTPTSGAAPVTVAFTDQSQGGPTSWSWNFGDSHATAGNPTTSTAQNPTHTYSVGGTYTVTLTVSNGTSSATTTQTNYITVGCVVPNFSGNSVLESDAQSTWAAAGFTSTVQFENGYNGAKAINWQSVTGGTVDSTCGISISVKHGG